MRTLPRMDAAPLGHARTRPRPTATWRRSFSFTSSWRPTMRAARPQRGEASRRANPIGRRFSGDGRAARSARPALVRRARLRRRLRLAPAAPAPRRDLAAVLSLGLAIGATTAAFRLVDGVLLRPLPVADPDRLFFVARTLVNSENRPDYEDDFDYPTFRRYAAILEGQADAMLVGMAAPQEVRFDQTGEPETARIASTFSGNVFPAFGLQPALGRLIAPSDDVTPGAHPVAVTEPRLLDAPLRAESASRSGKPSTWVRSGTKSSASDRGASPAPNPGRIADVFIPSKMNVRALTSPGWSWFRMWVRPRPGVTVAQVRQMLQTVFRDDHAAAPQEISRPTPHSSGSTHT